MAAECQTPSIGGKKRHHPSQQKPLDIPYFAHQQLDPRQFPLGKPGTSLVFYIAMTDCPGISCETYGLTQVQTGVGAPIAESPAMRKRRRISIGTIVKHVEEEGRDEEEETCIKYPGSDEDQKVCDTDLLVVLLKHSTLQDPTLETVAGKRRDSGTSVNESAHRSHRTQGGRPAIAKKLTMDLDSDDDMIVRMKEANYAEKDIAKRLADADRITYNPKTIGTRWTRLRRALAQHQDDLLEADLADWHEGDDDVLYQAVAKADQDIDTSINSMKARKWRMVADYVKVMKPATNFGQNACQKRFNDLRDGKAKPTPESIVGPDEKTLARIQARRDKESRIEEDRKAMPVFRAREEADLKDSTLVSEQGVQ